MLEAMASVLHEIAAAAAEETAVPSSNGSLSYVKSVELVGLGMSTTRELEDLTLALTSTPFPISDLRLSISQDVDAQAFGAFVSAVLQTKDLHARPTAVTGLQIGSSPPGKLNSLTLLGSSVMDLQHFASVFSALPFAQSLQILELPDLRFRSDRRLTEYACRWFAYAAFHPRAMTASWRGLALQHIHENGGGEDHFSKVFIAF